MGIDAGKIYEEAYNISHGAAVAAVWNAAVAETNRIRDDLADAISGVDIEALQAENAALKAQIAALTPPAPTPEPAPSEDTPPAP